MFPNPNPIAFCATQDIIKKLLVVDRTRRLGCVKGGGDAVMEHKVIVVLYYTNVG